MKLTSAIGCLLLGTMALSAQATDYYASSTNPNRSDSNSGTNPNAPWATMGKVKSAWSSLGAGDTIHLERGSSWDISFSGNYWYMSRGGSAQGGHITLRGDDYGSGSKPIIRRTGSGTGNGYFLMIQDSYITVHDFEYDGGHSDFGGHATAVIINADGSDIGNINVQNLKVHNLGGNSSTYICGIWTESWSRNKISNCLIEGNEVSDYSAHGLNHYSYGTLQNITWRNNIVKNNFTGSRYPYANCALQIGSGSSGCVFEYNYLSDTTSTEGNILAFGKNNSDYGVNSIRYNVLNGASTVGMYFAQDQTGYKMLYDVYGNIIRNNGRHGLFLNPNYTYGSGSILNFYNNTFYNNGSSLQYPEIDLIKTSGNVTVRLINNLLYHANAGQTAALRISGDFGGSLTHNNNLYWRTGGSSKAIDNKGTSYSLSNVNNFESSAQNTDPKLASTSQLPTSITSANGPEPDGLAVQASSPAIGNGVNLGSAYALGINNTPRTGAWTIGAYEAGSSPSDTQAPSVPANLSATAQSTSRIDLSWSASSDNVGVAHYQIYRNGSSVGTSTSTSYSDTGLSESTTYAFAVKALDDAGNSSAQSSPASATTMGPTPDTQAPTTPGSLTATAASATQVDLSWAASTDNVGVSEYRVYRNGSQVSTTSGTSYSDTGLSESTTYSYTVQARDAAGNASSQSSPASATTASANDILDTSQWENRSFQVQTNRLTVEYDSTASATSIDAVTGLSYGNATYYTDLAVIARFAPSGYIDARNGADYASDLQLAYSPGTVYHFRLEVDLPAHTYSVYVKAGSASEVCIASDYAFRTEQATLDTLDTIAAYSGEGNHQVLNVSVQSALIPEAPTGLHPVVP